MCVGLFTSRIMLEALGIDNYGVNNVVGGFVGLFTILTGTLTAAIGRYLTFGLGKGDLKQLAITFSTSINVLFGLSLIVFVLGETIGLWFVNCKLEFPTGRLYAANWLYQLSLFSLFLDLVSLPYSSLITAHEKMKVYAYMSMIDVFVKLILCYVLFIIPFDRLIFYASFIFFIALGKRLFVGWYCSTHFPECHYIKVFDRSLFKEIGNFAAWQFLGNTAWMLNTQGVNMLINIFFGVAFNAARGIAQTVQTAVMSFVGTFGIAFTPQITKSYAEGDMNYFFQIMERGSKFSVYLMLFFIIPLEFEVEEVLSLWLGKYPDYSPIFLRLSLICTTILLIGDPFLRGILATGKIRNYQIAVTLFGSLVFPFTWIAYRCGFDVQTYYYIFIIIYIGIVLIRAYFVQIIVGYSVKQFLRKVVLPVCYTTLVATIPVTIVYYTMSDGFIRLVIITFVSILSVSASVCTIGLTSGERNYIFGIINKKLPYFLRLGSKS